MITLINQCVNHEVANVYNVKEFAVLRISLQKKGSHGLVSNIQDKDLPTHHSIKCYQLQFASSLKPTQIRFPPPVLKESSTQPTKIAASSHRGKS